MGCSYMHVQGTRGWSRLKGKETDHVLIVENHVTGFNAGNVSGSSQKHCMTGKRMSIFRFPIKIKEVETMERKNWTRKRTFVLYVLSIPFIAALVVYYMQHRYEMVGTISIIAASIILFAIVETYLREVLEARRKRRGE